MKRTILVALGTVTVIASAAALGIGVALTPETQSPTRAQYEAALTRMEAAREERVAHCDAAAGNVKDLCRARAEAMETIGVADIEASFRRTRESARNAQRARIEARYQLERAACGALGGFKRDRCQISAHATRGRALLEAAAPYARS